MRGVRGGPIHSVHLVSQGINWRVDEKPGAAVSSTAPNNVRRSPAIPLGDFANDPCAIRGFRQVGADVVESLSSGVHRGRLNSVSANNLGNTNGKPTLICLSAASSLEVVRATITTFAPLAAS